MGQGGRAGRVHAHDKQRDEDHPQAGEEEQAASSPVVRQCCQDLRREEQVRVSGLLEVKIFSALCLKIKVKN